MQAIYMPPRELLFFFHILTSKQTLLSYHVVITYLPVLVVLRPCPVAVAVNNKPNSKKVPCGAVKSKTVIFSATTTANLLLCIRLSTCVKGRKNSRTGMP